MRPGRFRLGSGLHPAVQRTILNGASMRPGRFRLGSEIRDGITISRAPLLQ